MKSKKRYMWVVPVVALAVAALFVASHRSAAASAEDENGGVASPQVTLGAATRGVVFDTAAINPGGSIAKCFGCVASTTMHITTGEYQVGFNTNVQANNGWSRWVQVDTLSTGSINNVSCTTADRAGVASAVWVACFNNATGAPTDTSFFLFVAR